MKKLTIALIAVAGIELVGSAIAAPAARAQDSIPVCTPLDAYRTGSGFVRCNYSDGSNYIGTIQNYQPNGRGVYVMENARYEGEFLDGLPHGEGRLILDNDARYEGIFEEGVLRSGTGFYTDGSRYEGGFNVFYEVTTREEEVTRREGSDDGSEIEYEDTEEIQELSAGSFQPDGQGRFVFANGNRFEGYFYAGQPLGEGTFYHTNGATCQGEFYNLNFDASNAFCSYPNGATYRGELRQARPHGTGTLTYPDGQVYQGAFRNGQPVSFSGYQ